MSGSVLLDANILVLLAVGTASPAYISAHKNTAGTFDADDFDLGVTDAVLLHLCTIGSEETAPTLLTIDEPLAKRAASLGCSVIDYARDFQGR